MDPEQPDGSDEDRTRGKRKGSSNGMARFSSFRGPEENGHPEESDEDQDRPSGLPNGHGQTNGTAPTQNPTDREGVSPGTRPRPSSSPSDDPVVAQAHKGWSILRSRVVPSRSGTGSGPTPTGNKTTALAPTVIASVPVTTELMAGQLPVMMLKTWLDRDEDGNRAVPVLIGNLRFRVGDSVGLKEGERTGKEMFKLECEYGDGAVKWVSPVV